MQLFAPNKLSQPVLDGHTQEMLLLQDQGHVERAHLMEQKELGQDTKNSENFLLEFNYRVFIYVDDPKQFVLVLGTSGVSQLDVDFGAPDAVGLVLAQADDVAHRG